MGLLSKEQLDIKSNQTDNTQIDIYDFGLTGISSEFVKKLILYLSESGLPILASSDKIDFEKLTQFFKNDSNVQSDNKTIERTIMNVLLASFLMINENTTNTEEH